jgi:hypothetical protein
MKKMMFLAAVVSLATLGLCTSAAAQTAVPKNRRAMVACHGDAESCMKLDLYQAMAATSPTAGSSMGRSSNTAAAASARKPASVHRSDPAGGVENNPADESSAFALAKMRKNADKQTKLLVKNNDLQARTNPGARIVRQEALKNRLTHHGDDPTVNNPESDGATSRHHAVNAERPTTRPQVNRLDNKAPPAIRAREVTRHRPSDL